MCKDNKEHTQKIADILAQLLQAEDNAELSVVHNSLMTLFKSDAKGKKHVHILIAACILQLKIRFCGVQFIYTLVLKTIVLQSAYSRSSVHTCTVMFCCISCINPYPTAFPYGNGMVLHFYQQQESSTTKTVHKVINKGLKAYV